MNAKERFSEFVNGLMPPAKWFAWHFGEAMRQYKVENAHLSIRHLQECLEIDPQDWFSCYMLSLAYLQLIGDFDEALRLLRYARRLREQLHTPVEGRPRQRFLWPMWGAQIGHIANMEHLVKREILLGGDPRNLILYLPPSEKVANRVLLDKMGAYITIARSEQDLPYSPTAMLSVLEDYFLCEDLDGLTRHWWHASAGIFRAWEDAGRKPLLALTRPEIERGRACLRELGVPDDAWFACLHVREGGFKQDLGFGNIEDALNARISTYLPAIRAVTERGGWVVRIGDASMHPLPELPRTVDYALSAHKSDWMDIFLLGACRFFIGTSSGPAYVPPLFGVPCALTNWSPTGQRPFNGRDIYIPKLYRAGNPPRTLSFAEMMAPPIGYALSYVHAEDLRLALVSNPPEEIGEVVVEMLDRLDGTLVYTDRDEVLQGAFDAVAETSRCIGNARVGREFLRRNSSLLWGTE